MKKPLHRLLIRQLKRQNFKIEDNSTPTEINSLAESISNTYSHYESSMKLIERAMEISNLELAEANIKLIEESKNQKLLIKSLKESIKDISVSEKEIDEDNLINISKILKSEIKGRKKVEKDLKKAQILAEDSLKTKEIFLANMSHEIRTPLNAILGMTWLLSKTKLDHKQKKYKEVLRTASENLLSIINDILDISKITSGKLKKESIDFNIDVLLDKLFKTNQFKAEEKGIELIFKKDLKVNSFLKGDKNKLNQILINLVNNAIKFTSNGTVKVTVKLIETKLNSDLIEFCVIDSGTGISKKNIKLIFKSFSQEDASINRKYGGSGLGLTISKELVAALGGSLKVESEKNVGSQFSFIIELENCSDIKPAKKSKLGARKVKKDLTGCSILIVEDDEFNRVFLTSILEDWNVNLGIAENGKEAIDRLKNENFDIVLMDMHMPVMDGLTATREIRNTLKLDVPVIALTADVIFAKEKCFEVGMNDYISKPLNPNSLYNLIESYMINQ